MFSRCPKFIALLLITTSMANALELKFTSEFLELHSKGIAQKVFPGEFVEAPVGESSSLEIELSAQIPRKIEITSKGESEFVIFGAKSRLGDGGKMVASMSPETKKLDISWTKGEMSTPPGNFDKPAVVAFFTKGEDEFLRPMDFPGIRPFGYTDVLEGKVLPEDADLPYFPPPPQNSGYSGSGYPDFPPTSNPRNGQGWVAVQDVYEEGSSAPPPLTIPPPLPPTQEPPSQLVFLEPSGAKKSTDVQDGADENKEPQSSPSDSKKDQGKGSPDAGKEKSSKIEGEESSPSPSSTPEGEKMPAIPSDGKRRAKPTLYQMVMDQEKKQREFLDKIAEVAEQVKTIKEGGIGAGGTAPLPRAPETLTFLGESTPSLFAPLSFVAVNNSSTLAAESKVASETGEAPSEVAEAVEEFEVEVITTE